MRLADLRQLGGRALLNVLHDQHELLLCDLSVVVGIQLKDKLIKLLLAPSHSLGTLVQVLSGELATAVNIKKFENFSVYILA